MDSQNEIVGKYVANLLHSAMAWEEPLNSDDIDEIVKALKHELMLLSGEISE